MENCLAQSAQWSPLRRWAVETSNPSAQRRHVGLGTGLTLLAMLALLAQGFVDQNEAEVARVFRQEAEASEHRLLGEIARLVEKTIAIRIQRDALILETRGLGRANVVVGAKGPSLPHRFRVGISLNDSSQIGVSEPLATFEPSGGQPTIAFEREVFHGLRPVAALKATQLIAAARAEGIELQMVVGYRRFEQPRELPGVGQGVFPFASHHTGLAFDVAVLEGGRRHHGPSQALRRVGDIGKTLGLKWGGDFTRYQVWSHFEVPESGKTLNVHEDLEARPN